MSTWRDAIDTLRTMWQPRRTASVTEGRYPLYDAETGPDPAHPIGIWVQLVSRPHDLEPVAALLGKLDATITSHFTYEEDQLIDPLQRHGFYARQLTGR